MMMMLYGFARRSKAYAASVAMLALIIPSMGKVPGYSGCALGFVATIVTTSKPHPCGKPGVSKYQYDPLLGCSKEEGMGEFEAACQEFERLIMASDFKAPRLNKIHTVKPLTASSRRLMELELSLLKKLEESDDVVDPLVELWIAERSDAAKDLREMELGNCSPGLFREEAQLRSMIQRYGSEWVEPMSRLAVLLFTKGHLVEAMSLVRNVLQVKPWHFEAGQLLVVLLLRKGDFAGAMKAARVYTLPEFNENTQNRRRVRWVKEKVAQAQEILREALEAKSAAVHPSVTSECPVDEPYCWQ
jgi:hypothetical protein